jgi:hypothetical protein
MSLIQHVAGPRSAPPAPADRPATDDRFKEPTPLPLLGRRFPPVRSAFSRTGVTELAVLALLFVAYNVVRALPSSSAQVAVEHANRLLAWERPLFSGIELPLNHWLQATPALAVAACYYYALLHYLATPAILLIARRRGGWPYWRGYWTLILASAVALVGYATFPMAPPRLIPDLGIVDVMRSYADYGWWGSAASAPRGIGDATNQYAAMPSMHCGWALWCAIQMWRFGSRGWRGLALAYPSILIVVVIATGNHFVVDVLAGGACVALAYAVVEVTHRVIVRRASRSTGPEPARTKGHVIATAMTPPLPVAPDAHPAHAPTRGPDDNGLDPIGPAEEPRRVAGLADAWSVLSRRTRQPREK